MKAGLESIRRILYENEGTPFMLSKDSINNVQFGLFDKITGRAYDTNDSAFNQYYHKVFGWIKPYQNQKNIMKSIIDYDEEILSKIEEYITDSIYPQLNIIKKYISTLPPIYQQIFRVIIPGADQLNDFESGNMSGLFFLNSDIFGLDRKPSELVHDSKFVNDMAIYVKKIYTLASKCQMGCISYESVNVCNGYFRFCPDLKKIYSFLK